MVGLPGLAICQILTGVGNSTSLLFFNLLQLTPRVVQEEALD